MPSPDPAEPRTPADASGWRLRLLGAVEARRGDGEPLHWPSRPAAALLARLALAPQRAHPREELVELLWPGVALDVGRNRLRQTLSTLKRLLEDDAPGPAPIEADRQHIRLRAGSLTCDATEFERLARSGAAAQARALYGGELMPGHYEDWVLEARAALAALLERLPGPPMPSIEVPLPATWTRAYGIEDDVARLRARTQSERLVTLTGPGGCGKTRLALETARALRQATARGGGPFERVAFVPLVDCTDGAQATVALARALGLVEQVPLASLLALLAAQRTLLVLDNFEQLITHAAQLPLQLLEGAGGLHLLVTSRRRLGLPGEHVMPRHGLPLPAPDAERDRLLANPAIALFIDRARAVRADFEPTGTEAVALVTLVRLLDGMPLALELAASRVASFSPSRLLQMLTDPTQGAGHLQLLARPVARAGHDPRHASIADVIDWSWRLLSPPERQLLAALCACSGESDVPALAAVVGLPEAEVAAQLDDLAGHSMLHLADGPAASPRFAVLEPVRDFVRSHWPAADVLRLQHAELGWLLRWARDLGADVAAPASATELRNVRAALGNDALDPVGRWRLALALAPAWESRGMPAALQSALERALQRLTEAEGTPEALRLACLGHELLSALRFASGFAADAVRHADVALRLAGDDPALRARALTRQVWTELVGLAADDGKEARVRRLDDALQQAQALAQAAGDREALARALNERARLVSLLQNDWAGADALLAQAQALWTELGNRRMADGRLYNRARCWARLGREDEAMAYFARYERQAGADGNHAGQIDSLLSMSTLLAQQRRWAEALEVDRRCVRLCWQHWQRNGLAYALWNLAQSLARVGRHAAALQLMAFASSHWERHYAPLTAAERRSVASLRRLAQRHLGRDGADALWDEGIALRLSNAVALALEA